MKWFDRSWVGNLLNAAADGSYIPLYNQLLKYAAANSGILALVITILETTIGVLILLGVMTRVGGTIGALIDLNLLLTFGFCRCSWTQTDFPLTFWFYFFPLILNVQVIFDKSSRTFGLLRILRKTHFPHGSNGE
jgi:uncharacterized membrane protein YphA (DoxX/SURF4 family)